MSDNNRPPTFEPSASREAALSRYSTLEKLRYAFTKLQLDASALLDTINRNAFVSFVDGDVKQHAKQIFEEATASVYAVTTEQHFRMQESSTLPSSTKTAGFTLLDDLLADIKDIHRQHGPLRGMARYPKPPTSEKPFERCDSTVSIEDPVAVTPFRCEMPAGHAGRHRAIYPGVEGNVRVPITWYGSGHKIEFTRGGGRKDSELLARHVFPAPTAPNADLLRPEPTPEVTDAQLDAVDAKYDEAEAHETYRGPGATDNPEFVDDDPTDEEMQDSIAGRLAELDQS